MGGETEAPAAAYQPLSLTPRWSQQQPQMSQLGMGDEETADEDKHKIDIAGLSDPGIYVAVLDASFGALHVTVEKQGMIGRSLDVRVHPFIIWLLALPIFIVQVSAIMALRFDLDVSKSINAGDADKSQALNDLSWSLKLLMVGILQLTQFSELAQTMRYLALLLNPISWVEIEHPTAVQGKDNKPFWLSSEVAGKMPWLKHTVRPLFLCPWPFLALSMRFVVGYLVCIDSVSLILSSSNVKDAIFNSLAMTFVVELNRAYFSVCCIAFHLRVDEVPFKLNPDVWQKQVPAARAEPTLLCCNTCWEAGDAKFTDKKWDQLKESHSEGIASIAPWLLKWFPFLRRGHGAKTFEITLSALMLLAIYFQQMQVVLFAYKTDTLPVARDICTQWRWLTNKADFFKFVGDAFGLFERALLLNADEATADIYGRLIKDGINRTVNMTGLSSMLSDHGTNKTYIQKGCSKLIHDLTPNIYDPWMQHPYSDFYRMTMADRKQLVAEGPWTHLIGVACLLVLLLGSQGALHLHGRVFSSPRVSEIKTKQGEADPEAPTKVDKAQQDTIEQLRKDIDALKETKEDKKQT